MSELGSVNFSQSNEDVLENALDYVEFFSTYVDHLPPLLQRRISRLKEIDATTYKLCEEAEKLYQQILADRHSKKHQASKQKYKLINKLRETLTLCQQLGDEKMDIAENIETTIDQKAEVLNKKREDFMSSYNPQWKEELANKKKENSKSDHRPKRPKRTARNPEKHLDKDKSHTNGSFRLYVNNKHDSAASTSKTHNSGELETSSSSYSHHWGKYHQSDEPPSKREKFSLSSSTADHGKKATSSSSPADNSTSHSASLYSSAKPTASQSATSSSRSNNSNSTASSANSKSSSAKLNNSSSRSSSSAVKESGSKRKRKDNKRKQKTASYSGGASSPQNDVAIDPNEPLYCICKQVSYGSMVCCDNKKCPYQWFHFSCVGLTSKPKRQKWYCSECLKDRRNSRNNDK